MKLRYAGQCQRCLTLLPAGAVAEYDRATRTVTCLACHSRTVTADPPGPAGQAGSSARREYERRKTNREKRIRARHPHLGGIVLRLSGEPQDVRAWVTGAEGEERLGRQFDQHDGPRLRFLHDRRIPGSRANLDHLAVTPTGVYVIDAKNYAGRVQLRPGRKLFVGKRNCSRLVTSMHGQTQVLRSCLEAARIPVPITGVLCFVDAGWPWFRRALTVEGVHVHWPRRTLRALQRPGMLTEEEISRTHYALGQIFPSA